MIKNVILDVGKVLVEWEPKEALKKLGFEEKTIEVVANATVHSPIWEETDRGVWTDEQILSAFYENAPEYKNEIRQLWDNLELAITQFPYTKEWIRELKEKGFGVYILSNYGKWTYEKTKENALDFLPLTDGAIFSYAVKTVKPEQKIYQILLEKYSLRAEECVFIDDRMENIEGAKQIGMAGICFETIAQVKEQLMLENFA